MEMGELYQYINAVSIDMERRNKTEVVEKVTVKEFSKWYSERIKEYENIINEVEQKIGLESVCKKGCSGCCKQDIYINLAEYYIVAKYVEQLGYSKKRTIKETSSRSFGHIKAS